MGEMRETHEGEKKCLLQPKNDSLKLQTEIGPSGKVLIILTVSATILHRS